MVVKLAMGPPFLLNDFDLIFEMVPKCECVTQHRQFYTKNPSCGLVYCFTSVIMCYHVVACTARLYANMVLFSPQMAL